MGLGSKCCLDVLAGASPSSAVKWATLMVAKIQGASAKHRDRHVVRAQ